MTDYEMAVALARAALQAGDELVIHTFERAIRDERAACAKLADEAATRMLPAEDVNNATAARFQARRIAEAIRARGNS